MKILQFPDRKYISHRKRKNKIALDISLFIKSPKWCWFIFHCPITCDKCSEAWYTVPYEVIRHRQNGQVYYWITDFIWGVSPKHGNLLKEWTIRRWNMIAKLRGLLLTKIDFLTTCFLTRDLPICIGTAPSTIGNERFRTRSSSHRQSSSGKLTNLRLQHKRLCRTFIYHQVRLFYVL